MYCALRALHLRHAHLYGLSLHARHRVHHRVRASESPDVRTFTDLYNVVIALCASEWRGWARRIDYLGINFDTVPLVVRAELGPCSVSALESGTSKRDFPVSGNLKAFLYPPEYNTSPGFEIDPAQSEIYVEAETI